MWFEKCARRIIDRGGRSLAKTEFRLGSNMVGVTEVMVIISTVNAMKVGIEMTVLRWVRRAVTA